MSNLVLVIGESGSGKSTSIKGLDPKETVIFNILGKRLPFKGSATLYNEENKNLIKVDDWQNVVNYIKAISDKMPTVKNIVIDDGIYIMRTEFFNRSKEKGFDKYNELADHFRKVIASCSSQRDDLNIYMFLHAETEETEGSIVGYKSSSVGKLLDKMYRPEESTAITLFAKPKFDDKGKAEYGFYTHKMKVDGVIIPAKTPDGMFEEDWIPNDLGIISKAMKEYYG